MGQQAETTWTAVVRSSGEVALVQGRYTPLGPNETCVGTFSAGSLEEAWQCFVEANPISQSATTVLGMDAKTHMVQPDAVTRLQVPATQASADLMVTRPQTITAVEPLQWDDPRQPPPSPPSPRPVAQPMRRPAAKAKARTR